MSRNQVDYTCGDGRGAFKGQLGKRRDGNGTQTQICMFPQ